MKINKTKEGISLIVLVITIIVMIILAGAIILSLSNSGIIGKANKAKEDSDIANLREAANVAYGEWLLNSENTPLEEYIKTKLRTQGFSEKLLSRLVVEGDKISIKTDSGEEPIEPEQPTWSSSVYVPELPTTEMSEIVSVQYLNDETGDMVECGNELQISVPSANSQWLLAEVGKIRDWVNKDAHNLISYFSSDIQNDIKETFTDKNEYENLSLHEISDINIVNNGADIEGKSIVLEMTFATKFNADNDKVHGIIANFNDANNMVEYFSVYGEITENGNVIFTIDNDTFNSVSNSNKLGIYVLDMIK